MRAIVLLSVLLFSLHSRADSAGGVAAVFGAYIGIAAGSSHALYSAALNRQLKEWINEDTLSTAQLGSQCGLEYEAHLIGQNWQNSLFFTISNTSNRDVWLNLNEIRFFFGSGKMRFPAYHSWMEPSEVITNRLYTAIAPFPSKADFTGESSLKAMIPIYDRKMMKTCEISIDFQRFAGEYPKYHDFIEAEHDLPALEFDMGLGYGMFAGDLKKFSSGGLHVNILMRGMSDSNWGGFLGIGRHEFSGIDHSLFASEIGTTTIISPTVSILNILFGVTKRWKGKGKNSFYYDLGLNISSMRYNDASVLFNEPDDRSAFGMFHMASWKYRIGGGVSGLNAYKYYTGFNLSHYWYFSGNYGSLSTKGQNVALSAFIGYGI